MNDLFWIDETRNIKKTYNQLIEDLNSKSHGNLYICHENPYDVFLELIYSMAVGNEVVLLDYGLSETERVNLGISTNHFGDITEGRTLSVKSFSELLNQITEGTKTWRISVYTSGTTGRPKKVVHTLDTIARNVKKSDKRKNDVWALAYNPTHFAGLQVFFQAFFNQNPIIYLFDLARESLEKVLFEYQITNISATPTFFRTMIPYMNNSNVCLRRVTCGGEKFDGALEKGISKLFPNAQIRNIYASTEAGTLFTAEGEWFHIPDNIKKYILINDNNELLVHCNLLGFSTEYVLDGEWYNTGDVVELIDDNKFKIISRQTEMINVGGYKVNPHEIEEEIKKISGVVDVVILSRSNRITGNILIAEIIKESEYLDSQLETQIQRELALRLQQWKMPRIIKFVNEISKTRTGKKVR